MTHILLPALTGVTISLFAQIIGMHNDMQYHLRRGMCTVNKLAAYGQKAVKLGYISGKAGLSITNNAGVTVTKNKLRGT